MTTATIIKGSVPYGHSEAAYAAAEPGVTGATLVIDHGNPEQNEMLEPFQYKHGGRTYAAWMLWSSDTGVYALCGEADANVLLAEARRAAS